MRYLSVCSGIEAATMAWHPLGWEPVAFSEIDRFPSEVLAHHYPDVPNLGDMTRYREWDIEPESVDLLVGGTPCQSFSVAGLRKGLDDPRGNLALVFLGIADRFRPDWIVWENVPGVLSSNGGRDFGAFLGGLAELGYGFAYRVLDAQYVRVESHPRAVPQRRRRVFVVGHLGDWRRAAAVLLERESLSGHPAPRRTAGEGAPRSTAPSLTDSGRGVERVGESRGQDPVVAETLREHPRPGSNSVGAIALQTDATPKGQHEVAFTLKLPSKSGGGQPAAVAHSLRAEGFDASEDGTGRGTPLVFQSKASSAQSMNPSDIAPSLDVGKGDGLAVAFAENSRAEVRLCGGDGAVSAQLTTGGGKPGQGRPTVASLMAVRRLTPRECERLQGFPDDFTKIPYRGKPPSRCPDGPRYRALGNSMAVNVMSWIGQRIQMVQAMEGSTETEGVIE